MSERASGDAMPDEHVCEIFRREDDQQTLRDFVSLLQNGGMEKLRNAMQLGEDYKTVKEIGFKQIVKAVFNVIGVSIMLGLGLLLAKLTFQATNGN